MKIVVHDGDRSRVVAMALSGEIDVGLGCFLQTGERRAPHPAFPLLLDGDRAGGAAFERAAAVVALEGHRRVAPDRCAATNPIQQLIDRNLQRFGRREPPDMVFDYFETQIAMVEAGVGCAVIPTFAIPTCRRHRIAMHPLKDPVVPIDLCQIASRGRKMPPGFEDFTGFLKSYIAQWAEPWSPKFA